MENLLYFYAMICFAVVGVMSNGKHVDENVGGELMERIEHIEAIQAMQQKTIAAQQTEIAYLKSHCGKGDKLFTNENIHDRITDPVIQNLDRHDSVARRQATVSGSSFVSFSAYLDHDVDLPMFGKLVLNKEITNEGGAYDSTTGIFTCPVSGVYLFSFFLGQRDLHQSSLHLVVNNERTVDAVVETVKDTQDAQGGNVVIKRLDKGDQVWLKLIVGSHIEGASNMRVTSFSGVLLHE